MTKRLLSSGDDQGQILIMTAVSLVAVLAVAALSLDVSYMYDKRNRLHAAADAAAKSAAIEFWRNSAVATQRSLEAFADQQVAAHGFTPARQGGSTEVTVTWPATSSVAWYNSIHYVEVRVSEPTPTFFGRVLGWTSMTPGARAVAGDSVNVNCIITFSSFDEGNGNTLTMPTCGVSDGGTMSLGNGSVIDAAYVGVSGTCSGCGSSSTPNLELNAPRPQDPLTEMPVPLDPGGTCTAPLAVSGAMTLNPGKYCGWKFSGKNGALTLNAGVYYITGAISAANGGTDVRISGDNVLIYLAPGASLDLGSSNFVSMDLSGRVDGNWRGILFFQDRGNSTNAEFGKNNAELALDGTLYFPAANLTVKNNLTGGFGSDCTLIIANALTFKNNSVLGTFDNACSSFGSAGSPLRSVALAE